MKLNRMPPLIFRAALVLLCLVVLTSGMMGRLFAKYYATASGSDSARVARFSGGVVRPTAQESIPKVTFTNDNVGTYAFLAEFQVDFSDCEVTCEYTLTLGVTGNAKFSTSATTIRTVTKQTDGTGKIETMDTTKPFGLNTILSANQIYCFVSDSVNGTYTSCDSSSSSTQIAVTHTANIGAIHYYKVILFIDIPLGATPDTLKSVINYTLNCKQVD